MTEDYCKLQFTSEPTRIRNMVRCLMNLVDQLTPANQAREDLRLIFSELLYNAVVHGNNSDPDKRIRVRISAKGNSIKVTITDEGAGFDYRKAINYALSREALLDEDGRGMILVRALTDKLVFNEEGNQVQFEKRLR